MFKHIFLALIITLFSVNMSYSQTQEKHNYKSEQGYVPDAETAIKIAVAVLEPIYGKEKIAQEKPFKAVLNDDIWFVEGSMLEIHPGGVAEAEISKNDGRILRISHGQ